MSMVRSASGLYALGGQGGVDPSVIADPYSVSKAYSKGDLVMNNGYLYSALEDMEAGEWDDEKWLKTNVASSGFVNEEQLKFITVNMTVASANSAYISNNNMRFSYNTTLGIGFYSGYFKATSSFTPSGSGDWKDIFLLPSGTNINTHAIIGSFVQDSSLLQTQSSFSTAGALTCANTVASGWWNLMPMLVTLR